MTTPAWIKELNPTSRAAWALATAVGVGLTLALSLGGWFGLPAQVEVHTQQIAEIQSTHQGLDNTVSDILCILTQPEGANPLDCVRP